jgi:cyanophycin synthetase
VFADALVRSWKQVTKFRPDGVVVAEPSGTAASPRERGAPAGASTPARTSPAQQRAGEPQALAAPELAPVGAGPSLGLEGLIRDERGIRFAPETED